MIMINDFIWSVRHTIKCIKLMPYAVMYKDEAEDSRAIISDLKCKNEKLTNQCKMQEEIINGLFETLKNKIDDGKGH